MAMLAGDNDTGREVAPLLAAMCSQIVLCRQVPNALPMKLAVRPVLDRARRIVARAGQ
jgi:hypothetical protein